jgi:DUF2993 family protein
MPGEPWARRKNAEQVLRWSHKIVPRAGGRGAVWGLAVCVIASAVAINLATPAIAAAALEGYLRGVLHAGRVQVGLAAWPPPALWWGRVDRLTVAARDVQMGTVRLDTFTLTLGGLRFDPGALYLDHTLVILARGPGVARGTVSQVELARILALQPGVRVDSVVVRPGAVFLRGAVRALGVDVPAEGSGRLVLNTDGAVDLILEQFTVAGGVLPVAVRGRLTTRLRGVLSVPPLPLGFRLTGVKMDDGRLVLDAGTAPS